MILIVAPDAAWGRSIRSSLGASYPCQTALSSGEAFHLAKIHPLQLALIRFQEPIPQTYDLIQGLLDFRPHLTILLSCTPEHRQAAHSLSELGLATLLTEPIQPEALLQQVREMLPDSKPAATVPASSPVTPIRNTEENGHPPEPADLERLVVDLAHRLKNPLVSIRTFTHLLKEKFDDAQFKEDFYQTIRQEVEKMDGLIDQLIEFSELPHPRATEVPLSQVLAEATEQARPYFRDLPVHFPEGQTDGEIILWADREQLTYALVHLLRILGRTLSEEGTLQIQPPVIQEGSGQVQIRMQHEQSAVRHQNQFVDLELFVAKRVVENLNGSLHFQVRDEGQLSVSLSLPLAAARHRKQSGPPAGDRRRQKVPIPFRDRRRLDRYDHSSTVSVSS